MYVYFNKIKYQGKPLLWKVDKENNTAICMYECHRENKPLDSKKVNAALKDIIGIDSSDSSAKISDYQKFLKKHSAQEANQIRRSSSAPKIVVPRQSSHGMFSSNSNSPSKKPSLTRTLSTPHYLKTFTTDETPQSLFEIVTLPSKGETTAYYTLAENSTRRLNESPKGVLAPIDIKNLLVQLLRDEYLHPFRVRQLDLLKQFFDQYLEPIYSELKNDLKGKEAIELYLQNAVLNGVRQVSVNNLLTVFNVRGPLVPHNQKQVIQLAYQQKQLIADFMIMYLEFFIRDDLQVEDILNEQLVENKELITWLNEVKKKFLPHQKELAKLFNTLKLLTVYFGIISYELSTVTSEDCKKNSTYDISELTKQMAEKSNNPLLSFVLGIFEEDFAQEILQQLQKSKDNTNSGLLNTTYHSLSALIDEALEKIYSPDKLKKKDILPNLKKELTKSVIQAIYAITNGDRHCPEAQYITTLTDDDLYVRREWKEELMDILEHQLLSKYDKKKESSISSKANKYLEKLISSFFKEKVDHLVKMEMQAEKKEKQEKEEQSLKIFG
ncbi:hypothetical protein E3983_06795 [Legionella israelensis]|uniref:Uncharacterized protein n=1 Tax=Legionella israelensis TaxID=454 RepID=A0AAX1EG12_9GAMM|nr:hypothetical protein [Legionella israelensis]QBR84086.1 hypothetical protein E3983_06795 [Legionella israelensis]